MLTRSISTGGTAVGSEADVKRQRGDERRKKWKITLSTDDDTHSQVRNMHRQGR